MRRIVLSLATLLACAACSKVEESDIPVSPVYFTVDLRFEDKGLVPLYAHKSFTQPRKAGEAVGYSGLLLFHGTDNGVDGAYYAYDLCCPYEVNRSICIEADDAGQAKCPQCGSLFYLDFGAGNPSSGPARYPLRRYQVITRGQELLITN